MGHAYEQGPIHKEPDQAAMINRTMDIMEKFTGKRPVGWLGPGLTQTLETPDLLAAAGVKYIGDWVYDDEPTVIRTAQGPAGHAALHDRVQRHPGDDRPASRQRLSAQAGEGPVRPALCRERDARQDLRARHPSLHFSGQPHRIKYLEAIYDYVNKHEGVLHWNGEQILDWYNGVARARRRVAFLPRRISDERRGHP